LIDSDKQLEAAVAKAGELLQEIHNYCCDAGHQWGEYPKAKVRFPRGFIRAASGQRTRIPFVQDSNLKSNIAYTLILSDAILWLSIRTDIWGVPQEMLTKVYVFILGSICESITKDYLRGVCGKNYKGRTEYLAKNKIIKQSLKEDLDWLWDTRNNMHLFMLDRREYETDYNHQCHTKAVLAFRGLIRALRVRGRVSES
jgi:hypothetical protein